MVELYANIPIQIKETLQEFIDTCIKTLDMPACVNVIREFVNSCRSEEEKEFIDFYFNFKLEQLRNESIND